MQTEQIHAPKKHRLDIDGLRAVAVLMVLGSHLGTYRMAGGYIGVDIFFVISGYLITGIVARDIAKGRFSIATFYERRIKRIFPALLVMLVFATAATLLLFPPAQLIGYGYSLLAALFSYANLYFATKEGYFSESYTKILQHTWSLGVEEQFYLVLPLVMMFTARWSKSALRWFIGAIWVVSFAWACWLVTRDVTATFYMPYTRAWELATGSALALDMVPMPKANRWLRECLGLLSILVLFVCMAHYSSSTVFPGLSALAPVLASMTIIGLGETGTVLALKPLEWRPVVFIGAISYSLYLWHWPVLTLARLGVLPGVDLRIFWQQMAALAVSILLATASWWFVETPFRVGRWRGLTRGQVYAWGLGGSAVFAVGAIVLVATHGLPGRFPTHAAAVGAYLDQPQQMNKGVCFYESAQEPIESSTCLTPVAGKKNVLLLGDSHAAMYWYGLTYGDPTVHLMQLNASGCYPYFGGYDRGNCGRVRRYLYETYLPGAKPDAVVLTGRWEAPGDFDQMEPLLKILAEKNVPVYVLGPVPEFQAPLPLLLSLGLKWSHPELAAEREMPQIKPLDRYIAGKLQGRVGVTYLSAYHEICGDASCRLYTQNTPDAPLLIDDNHLSNLAALELVKGWVAKGLLPR